MALFVETRPLSVVAFSLLYVALCRLLGLVRFACRSEADKDIEIMVLRHQIRILERYSPGRVRYRPADRAILAALSRLLPRNRWRSFMVTPDTLLRWRREAAKCKWRRWRKNRGPGRPTMSDELVDLIVRLGRENRSWGCIRIQGEMRKLGIRVSASSIRRVLRRHRLGPAEGHQNPDQAPQLALDIDVRPSSTVAFSLLYVGLCRILGLIASFRRTESDTDIEIMVLRHQVRILERQLHARVRYRPMDRAILAAFSRLVPRARWRSFLVTPDTLLRWHREAAKHKWRRWRKQRGPGRPRMNDELVGLIGRLGRENRRWGCVRIQGELRKLGIRVSASSVRRVLRQHGLGPVPRSGPTWSEFLRSQAHSVLATDFFTVDTVALKQL
jgi:transposase